MDKKYREDSKCKLQNKAAKNLNDPKYPELPLKGVTHLAACRCLNAFKCPNKDCDFHVNNS